MEVLYHIRAYFLGIFPYIGLIYGRYLQFRFLKWPLIITPAPCHFSFEENYDRHLCRICALVYFVGSCCI